MDRAALKKGGRYNWVGQPERLIYMGTRHYPGDRRAWHQFSLVGADQEVCWCEVLESDLAGFEETPPCGECGSVHSAGQNTLCKL